MEAKLLCSLLVASTTFQDAHNLNGSVSGLIAARIHIDSPKDRVRRPGSLCKQHQGLLTSRSQLLHACLVTIYMPIEQDIQRPVVECVKTKCRALAGESSSTLDYYRRNLGVFLNQLHDWTVR